MAKYTKAILTLGVASLITMACHQVTSGPGSTVRAAGKFADIQFSGVPGGMIAVDTRTGDVWSYESSGSFGDKVLYMGRIDELGKPLVIPASAPSGQSTKN